MTGTREANYHAVPHPRGWSVRKTDRGRALAIFASQWEAWIETQRRAREGGSVAYLHDAGGRVSIREDYRVRKEGA